MADISGELAKQKANADQITALISGLQSQATDQMHQFSDRSDGKTISSIPGSSSVLDSVFQTPERPTIASLQAKQTSCIVKGIKYVGNGISSFVSDKVKVLDESWENFQIGVRNGGVSDDEMGDSSSFYFDNSNHSTPPIDTRRQSLNSSSYSYQAIETSDNLSGRDSSHIYDNPSGRDLHTLGRQGGGRSGDNRPWERK